MIEKGSVDLLVEEKSTSKILLTFEENELFYSLSRDVQGYHFTMKLSSDAKLRKVPFEQVKKEPLERWIRKLYEMLLPFVHENIDFVVPPLKQESFELQSPSDIAPLFSTKNREEIQWFQVVEGEAFFLGISAFPLTVENAPIPLSIKGWISANNRITLQNLSTSDLLQNDWFSSVHAFLQLALIHKVFLLEKRKKDEIDRVFLKQKRENLLLKETWKEIASIFDNKRILSVDPELPLFFRPFKF